MNKILKISLPISIIIIFILFGIGISFLVPFRTTKVVEYNVEHQDLVDSLLNVSHIGTKIEAVGPVLIYQRFYDNDTRLFVQFMRNSDSTYTNWEYFFVEPVIFDTDTTDDGWVLHKTYLDAIELDIKDETYIKLQKLSIEKY